MSAEWPLRREDFLAYYKFAPAALAIRECVRLAAVRDLDLPEPILDVGCGDGLFARLAYPGRQTWGIDINPDEVRRAQATQSYRTIICGSICDADLPPAFFESAIANCSLEHVPDIDAALRNVRSALVPGAMFVLIVPTPDWTEQLLTRQVLERVGLGGLGRAYGEALDRVFFHVHLYDAHKWGELLDDAGFDLVEHRPLVGPSTSWAFDAMLYPSALGLAVKKLTGRWVMAPALRGLSVDLVHRLANAVAQRTEDRLDGPAGELVLIARAREA